MGRDCDGRNCDAGPDVVSAWEGIDRLGSSDDKDDRAVRVFTTEKGTDLPPIHVLDPIIGLIRIAEGGNYTPPVFGRRHWYGVRQEMLQGGRFEHGLEAQVDAIRRLGETRRFDAQQYLEGLLRYEVHTISWWPSGPRHDDEDRQPEHIYLYSFPNAKGELYGNLAFSTQEYYAGRYPSEFRTFIQKQGGTNARLIVEAINGVEEHLREERLAELRRQKAGNIPAHHQSLSDVALGMGLNLLFRVAGLGYKVYSRYKR